MVSSYDSHHWLSHAFNSLPSPRSAHEEPVANALTASEETATAAAQTLAKVFLNFIFLSSIKIF